MGKKSKAKKNLSTGKGMENFKLKDQPSYDSLHEGRIYDKRRIGMWSTYNAINRLCNDTEKEDGLSLWGEKI